MTATESTSSLHRLVCMVETSHESYCVGHTARLVHDNKWILLEKTTCKPCEGLLAHGEGEQVEAKDRLKSYQVPGSHCALTMPIPTC